MLGLVLLVAFVWGLSIACFAQFTGIGRYICMHRSWIAYVAAGIGNMLLLLLLTTNRLVAWDHVAAIFLVSSVPIICRGIWQEYEYIRNQVQEQNEHAKDAVSQQDAMGVTGHDLGL